MLSLVKQTGRLGSNVLKLGAFKLKEVGFPSNKDDLWASGPRWAFHFPGHILRDDPGLDRKLTGQMRFFI